MNYKTYPVDYINELRAAGKRKKSMAFMDYWHDLEMGEYNAERFYAKSWNVSPSTAHEWIKEFKDEIDKFLAHWQLKNEQHYNNVKKLSEQKSSKLSREKARKLGEVKNTAEQQSSEVFNIYTTTNKEQLELNRKFEDLIFIYQTNGGKVIRDKETYEAFIKAMEDIKDINLLKASSIRHLHDNREKPAWLRNFLENMIYRRYLTPVYEIKRKTDYVTGKYNKELNRFETLTNEYIELDNSTFERLMANGRIKIIGYAA
ncbi:hypothetical protein [Nitrosophilus kaiyonis]|uniref:hypothetical protein n=1 Tax=Nitrosophilus kaiyonis TaxID=2930200 RepID=UPI0024914521|nr:hypothetical protein [Nitrosophilus kaiyonis]